MLANEEISGRVMDIVARISGIPREEIQSNSTFEDLELDSLSRIELLVDLEREFSIETPDEQDDEDLLKQINSVEDATSLVEKNLASQNAA